MNLQYQYNEAFWLLGGIALFLVLYLAYLLWRKKVSARIGEPRLVKQLTKGYSPLLSVLKFSLLLVAFGLGCLALANPRRPDASGEDVRKGIDVVIALDISNSMLATDVAPNRLTKAKQFINKLVAKMENDRIALILFAGNAYTQLPLTFDYGAAGMYVNNADPSISGMQGTAISEALRKSSEVFGEESERFKTIILITDGETHDENALKTLEEEVVPRGIMVNAIGIGSPEGASIKDTATGAPKRDEAGNIVISKLNESLLQELAEAGKGTYQLLQNTDDAVKGIEKQFAGIEKKGLVDTSLLNYKTFYAWVAVPMLLLLLGELFVPGRKKIKA